MDSLFYVREEIVCLAILFFLGVQCIIYKKNARKDFMLICSLAFLHVSCDLVTVIMVNNEMLNGNIFNIIFHYMFFISGVLFSCQFCRYVGSLVSTGKTLKLSILVDRIIFIVYLCLLPFGTMTFGVGERANYAQGSAVVMSYLAAGIYFISSAVAIAIRFKTLPRMVRYSVGPVSILIVLFLLIQFFWPEFLFTGADTTLITMSIYFTIENPTKEFQHQAYYDVATGLKNKNCYEQRMEFLEKRLKEEPGRLKGVSFVVCDVNGLKKVNDTLGHAAGDEMIRKAARAIRKSLESADGIYRTGGDEFVALYMDIDPRIICLEVENISRYCEKERNRYVLSVAAGCAFYRETDQELSDIANRADADMYKKKQRQKKQLGI